MVTFANYPLPKNFVAFMQRNMNAVRNETKFVPDRKGTERRTQIKHYSLDDLIATIDRIKASPTRHNTPEKHAQYAEWIELARSNKP